LEMAKESVSGGTDFAGKLADQMTETGIQDLSRDGQGILSSIFGDKLGGMTSWFAKFGGIKSTSVSSLLSMAASLVMGVLGKQALTNGLNASGLAGLLSNQKGWLARMLPSGLGDIPGFSKLSEYVQQAGESIRGATRQGERAALSVARSVQPASKPWMSAIAPVLALCLALIALPLLMRGCATKTITVAKSQPVVVPNDNGPQSNVPTTKTSDVRGRAYPPDLGKMMIVKLPDGADLELPEASFLSGMHKYLADKGDVRPRSFVFERIEFEGAGIKSTGESTNYIKILSALLNAFPGVDLRIEGHTDDIDDQESAKRISLLRAEAVKTLLVERGVPADRIQTKGYGSEKPVVPNDTAENREKNRRIELAIVKQ
jgi:outer membrane protein OmpA-like peptidoglycan-associated protein